MGAVTYPNPEVERLMEENFIPVQFNTPWTPTLIVQDADGREHRRSQGYLDARRFLGEMALARLKTAIDRQDFAAAEQRAPEALQAAKGDPEREPEATYWAGVAAYKATHDPGNLLKEWNRLLDQFPDSDWAKKVE